MPELAAPRPEGVSGSLREAVLAGPGAGVAVLARGRRNPLAVVATPARVEAALAAAGHADKCRAILTGAVTTVLVVGLCLYCGEGYTGVIGRLWPLLGSFNPAVVMSAPVTAVALSQARARLPAGVLRALFEADAAAMVTTAGSLVFGLVVTAELVYKSIKSTLRGGNRRLRDQAPELAEQEIWGLLTVYNALVDQAVTAAIDLGIDPDEISFTVVLRAARDHLATHAPCRACGHQGDPADLTAAITAGPRNRTDRTRTSPRTKKQRQTQHTRDVAYTITITESNLPRAA